MRKSMLYAVMFVTAAAATAGAAKVQLEDGEIKKVAAAPNREVVKPMAPDWCGNYQKKGGQFNFSILRDAQGAINDRIVQNIEGDRIVRELGFEDFQELVARPACEWPDDPSIQKQVAYWRQLSVNYSGLSEKEDRASLAFLFGKKQQADKEQDEAMQKYAKWDGEAGLDTGTSKIRFLIKKLLFEKNALVTKLPEGMGGEIEFFLDTPGRLTGALERVSYAWMCLQPSDERVTVPACGGDARRVDVKAVDEEAAKLGLNELGRLRAHTYAVAVKTRYADALARFLKDDAGAPAFGYKKYGLDHLEEAWTQWEKEFYPAHKELYDRIGAVEAAYFKTDEFDREHSFYKAGTVKDCDFIRGEYVKAATEMKPKSQDDFNMRVGADPWIGYLLEHAAMCDAAMHRPMDAWAFLQLMYDGANVPARGPRYAAHIASAADLNEQNVKHISSVHLERPADQLYKELRGAAGSALDHPRAWQQCETRDCYRPEGRVATAKKGKDGVTVSFKKETIWQLEKVCKDSSKVRRIMSDGKPEYEQDCKAGNWYSVVIQTEPVTVYDVDAGLLKPGQFARFVTAQESGRDGVWGFPVEIKQPATQKGKADKLLRYGLVPIVAK